MSNEYDLVAKGKLRIKSDSSCEIKKKKKHKKKDKEKLERVADQLEMSESTPTDSCKKLNMTKAEMAFKKMQEKMVSCFDEWVLILINPCAKYISFLSFTQQEKRIMEKAQMTHKQRVEKFNEHLDSLTEHFDIPKVSWTK